MIIAICGLSPQAGKTTTAEYIVSRLGRGLLAEFSEPIELYAYEYTEYNGDKSDPTQRKILQDIGMMFKNIDPSYWVYRSLFCVLKRNSKVNIPPHIADMGEINISKYKKLFKDWGIIKGFCINNPRSYSEFDIPILISGTRSPAEVDEIKKLGGKSVLIKRSLGEDSIDWQDHKVESELLGYKNFDIIIENNGTLEDLYKKIENKILESINEA